MSFKQKTQVYSTNGDFTTKNIIYSEHMVSFEQKTQVYSTNGDFKNIKTLYISWAHGVFWTETWDMFIMYWCLTYQMVAFVD